MAAANLVGVVTTGWATTLDRQQLIAGALNALAGLAVLALIEVSGATDRYAAPALLLIAIFAFVVIRLRFVFALVAAGTYMAGYVFVLATGPIPGTALDIFLVGGSILAGLSATNVLERRTRDVFAQRRLIEQQAAELAEAHATSERLLVNVLPGSVAERLKGGETPIADAYADATVLFADLVGFTPLASTLSPPETVELLDRLFSAFDELAERHGLEKIKTIGDAYMVVGGVPEGSTDHPARVVAMGLDMLRAVAVHRPRDGPSARPARRRPHRAGRRRGDRDEEVQLRPVGRYGQRRQPPRVAWTGRRAADERSHLAAVRWRPGGAARSHRAEGPRNPRHVHRASRGRHPGPP